MKYKSYQKRKEAPKTFCDLIQRQKSLVNQNHLAKAGLKNKVSQRKN